LDIINCFFSSQVRGRQRKNEPLSKIKKSVAGRAFGTACMV
jgi:hypothetical protein